MPGHHQPLTSSGPLPHDVPFTRAQALHLGVPGSVLRELTRRGCIRQVLHGVWVSRDVADALSVRVAALALVVPESAVVTDRTAAWLHGVAILPRTAQGEVPLVSVYGTPGTRIRRSEVDGGERALLDRDIMEIGPVRVTTPLRTACDLGRSLWRFDALAALDGFLRIGVTHRSVLEEVERFRRQRGVVQLRDLAPIADGRAESPGESALRLHWYDAGLPPPELQWWVYDDHGRAVYRLDLALPEIGYCAEYDGEQHHTSEADREADRDRRTWLATRRRWHVAVFTKHDVYDPAVDPCPRLRAGYGEARMARGLPRW